MKYRFQVTGVDKKSHDDVEVIVEAATDENARVKAELKGIIVTDVTRLDVDDAATGVVARKADGTYPFSPLKRLPDYDETGTLWRPPSERRRDEMTDPVEPAAPVDRSTSEESVVREVDPDAASAEEVVEAPSAAEETTVVVSAQSDERTTTPEASSITRYCRRCRGPLIDLFRNHCPECGLIFNPNDPNTYSLRKRRVWPVAIWAVACVVVLVGLVVGWHQYSKWRDGYDARIAASKDASDSGENNKIDNRDDPDKLGPAVKGDDTPPDPLENPGKVNETPSDPGPVKPTVTSTPPKPQPDRTQKPIPLPLPAKRTLTAEAASFKLLGPWEVIEEFKTVRIDAFHRDGTIITTMIDDKTHQTGMYKSGKFAVSQNGEELSMLFTAVKDDVESEPVSFDVAFDSDSECLLTPTDSADAKPVRLRRFNPQFLVAPVENPIVRYRTALDELDRLNVLYDESSGTVVFVGADDTRVAEVLAPMKDLYHLRKIKLRRARVTNASLARLKVLDSIDEIDLSYTPINDDGLKHLRHIKGLKRVALERTNITDEGLKFLSELQFLEEIDLSSTKVSDKGLLNLRGLKRLYKIGARGTDITPKGSQRLSLEMPSLKLIVMGPPER